LTEWLNFTESCRLARAWCSAMLVSTIACTFGFRTTGARRGRPLDHLRGCWSFVAIIIADFIIVRIAFLFFPSSPEMTTPRSQRQRHHLRARGMEVVRRHAVLRGVRLEVAPARAW